jgi:hypothetical protein
VIAHLQVAGCAVVDSREVELVGLSATVAAASSSRWCSRADPDVGPAVP